jgi:hypothetical protein
MLCRTFVVQLFPSLAGQFGRNVCQFLVRRTSCMSEDVVAEWYEEVLPVLYLVGRSAFGIF